MERVLRHPHRNHPGQNTASNLAKPVKIRITRASADPGRELNGRSQQILSDFGVAGPVGPSSRVSAF